jgi:predicted nucleotidyltransferase
MVNSKNAYEKIKEKLNPIFRDPELQLVVLFGSHATGRVHSKSDIDLGFLYGKPIEILDLTNRVIQCLETDKVDVIDLRRASPLLCFCAARAGKLLFEKTPGQFNAFYSLSFRKYMDTKKLRDAQQEAIHHFLREKGLS